MTVRYPRGFLQIDGARLPLIGASVSRSAQRRSDRFQALLSITACAKVSSRFDLAYWTDFQPTDASIVFSLASDKSDERVMITGKVDMPNVALATMQVALSGRDKGASLTEKKRNEKFANQKPKDIAKKIAKDHGLELEFKGEAEFSGKIYDQDTANLVLNRTDFAVLSNLAEQIGYRWYVDGSTLYMEPKDEGQSSYDVVWIPPTPGNYGSANVMDLALKRDMDKARPTTHRVKSWHHRSRKIFKHEAQVDGIGSPLVYEDHHSGKTQAQVEKLAKSRLRDSIRHELGVSIRAPADLTVDVRQTLNLSGTGTIFDQAYAIDSVTWNFGYGEPFEMNIDANAAKAGRDPEGNQGGSGSGASSKAGPGGAGAAQNVPLPPARPAGLGGGGGTGPVISV